MATSPTSPRPTKLNSDTLKSLAMQSGECLVSIFAPMQRAGREVQQNEINWKNLLQEAREKLTALEVPDEKIDSLLESATARIGDDDFWQHQDAGLACFINGSECFEFKTSNTFKPEVFVGDQFHMRPLVPTANEDAHCYILAATPNRVRLLEVDGDSVEDLQLDSLPENLRDALNIDEYVSALQFHSTSRGGSDSGQAAVFHGHGGSDPDVKKQDELLQFFHRLDDALSGFLAGKQAPLIFAGVESVFPVFKTANKYQHLLDEFIPGSPDEETPEQLHASAKPILSQINQCEQDKVLASYQNKAHTDWASCNPREILTAAQMGQVDTLFISDKFTETAVVAEGDTERDLGNTLVIETLRSGGSLLEITDQSMPNEEVIAATFRSPVGNYATS